MAQNRMIIRPEQNQLGRTPDKMAMLDEVWGPSHHSSDKPLQRVFSALFGNPKITVALKNEGAAWTAEVRPPTPAIDAILPPLLDLLGRHVTSLNNLSLQGVTLVPFTAGYRYETGATMTTRNEGVTSTAYIDREV